MPQVTVTVTIAGKAYRMACEEGQEAHLQMLAGRVDDALAQLKGSFGEIGDTRLTVMASIMIMDELVEAQRQLRALEAENQSLREMRLSLVERQDAQAARVAARVQTMAERVETVIASLAPPHGLASR